MNNINIYLQTLQMSKGAVDEIMLGEMLGLEEDATRRIIASLLNEYKITYSSDNNTCNYKPIKKQKKYEHR